MSTRWVRFSLLVGLGIVSSACDRRTPEERGKGVGDTVKGTGSGVNDALHSPVNVLLDAPLTGQVKVLKASGNTRTVAATLEFPQRFEGRLALHALGENSVELGRAEPQENFSQVAGSQRDVSFEFPADTRLSNVSTYVLFMTPPKR